MRYYELHEKKYRRLRDRGLESWDEWLGEAPDFDSFRMREFATFALDQAAFAARPPAALEVGCGTGPLCCFLAARGFEVQGIDISPTAIEIAREQARRRGLAIRYWVADACRPWPVRERLDLVVDGHFLHCVVFDEERILALANIREALEPGGEFWLETAIAHPHMVPPAPCRMDGQGILWVATDDPAGIETAARFDGVWHVPVRKLLPGPEAVERELERAGFDIAWKRHRGPEAAGHSALFQAICVAR